MADRAKNKRQGRDNLHSDLSHTHTFNLSDFRPPAREAPVIAHVDRVSADNRRVYSEAFPLPPPSPVKRARDAALARAATVPQPLAYSLVDDEERYRMDTDAFEMEEDMPEDVPARSTGPADPAMHAWREQRDVYLRTLLWLDGARVLTAGWVSRSAPLHQVERWTGSYFARYSLQQCGLRVQVGHPHGCPCSRPRPGRHDFVAVHINGIHDVSVDFCGCYHTSDPEHIQLLKAGWYPATTDTPRTCFTLECLNHFQTLTLHGKTTVYDYYATLETLTNAVGVKPPDRYRVFLRVSRQFRHLMLLKRAGRGHDEFGVLATGAGELAIRCPACPRVGVNIPDDWKNCAPEDRVLYTQAIALDACFRLKRRLISSDAKDPGLGTGWAYMVDLGPYMEYVRRFGDQTEMSSCSGLAALDHANTKFSARVCSDGRRNGSRGERFCNMDYLFWSMLRHLLPLIWFLISYDIACQWYKNLRSRYDGLPNHLKLPVIWTLLKFVVPKMHLRGHVLLCRLFFSWLFTRGGAMGDGEGIEPVPVHAPDALDDHFGFINWVHLLRLAALLRRRSDRTDEALEKQEAAFAEFCEKQAEDAEAWKELVHAFEEDNTQPNPYKPEEEGMTEQEVRARFEEEEAREEAKGKRRSSAAFMPSPVSNDLKQRQCVSICARRRKNLNKKIAKIRLLQAIYMPAALRLLERQNLSQETLAEKVPLLPPSALSVDLRDGGGCREGLVVIEKELRHAQCRTGLAGLRAQLHNKFRLLSYKKGHILLRADKYQAARRALVALAEDGDTIAWPVLRKEDIRCVDDTDDAGFEVPEDRADVFADSGPSEALPRTGGSAKRPISWIWRLTDRAGTDAELREALRIQFCKEYAKTLRWREEKRVLVEEQQRLPLSFGFEERKWIERAGKVKVGVEDEATAEGMIAYAAKQADMRATPPDSMLQSIRRGLALRTPWTSRAAGGDAASMGEDDGDEPEFAGEEIEEDIDEHGNASDEDDEAFIMDGDPFDD
ncbi:CxC2 domain-containing protein [Mycena kentingensis (nom. inval.)]|nr:CxC2 domain-containing protein [Mycena kentingensis (nom. inval.)]